MAVTIGTRTLRMSDITRGGKKIKLTDVTLDNYVTNGYAITAKQLGMDSTVDYVGPVNSLGYVGQWDYANSKLKFYSASGTELANASAALAAQVVRLRAEGF